MIFKKLILLIHYQLYQNISIKSKIYVKNILILQTRLMESGVYNTTPLPYPSTQFLLPSPLKHSFVIPKKSAHTHNGQWTPPQHMYKYDYGVEINFFNIKPFILVNIILLHINIFFVANSDVLFHSTQVNMQETFLY